MLRAFLGSGLLLWVVLAQSTNGTNHSAQSKGEHGTGQHHEPKGTHHDIHDKPQARPEPEQEKRRGRTESHQRHQREQREQVQQPQQPQVPAAEERNWHEFLPHFARQYTSQRHGEQSEWGQLAAAPRASLRGTLLSAEAPDYASVAAREASLRAVSDLEQQEARAAATARDTLHALRQTSSKDILSKASDWHSIQDLVALSRQKDAKSLQDRLEATTKQLEEFSSQQTAAGFNATRAAELMDNLDKAVANVAQSVEVQRKRAKAAIKAARQDALGQVRQLEKRARAAVRSWRSDGRHAVNAQRQANMPEQLYESHDDQMRDAVGDTEQEVENAAEGLKDSINEHYGKLDDELEDVSIGASSKALRHRAEKAQHRLQELARNLGVQAALLEALAKARFAAEEKSWKDLHAPQLLAAVPRSANMSSEVATAQAQEQHAADSFQNSLNSLKDMSTPEVIRKVNGWQTLQELVAGSKPKETDSWEKTLESQTKKLERFNNESRKSALDFDASHAAELADAVEKASWHVEHDAEEQKHRMKATLKDARRKAHQHVKALEAEAKAAAKSWKYHGRRAVRAQRAAHMPEHVYERHEDHMEDAVGDAEDKAEDAAERLEEQLSHHYEKLEDELADASFDASGKALRQRAEKAQHRLQELARNLGAHAALKEALAKARFAAEEKSWKESRAPQLLAAVPHSANMSSEVATAQAQEQHAADSFQNSLNSLKDMSTPEVIRKVNGWQTLQELVAGSKPKETDSWEKTLESQTKKLERFNNESRKSALDFDASHAAELADAVEKASWHVEHDAEEQKHRMKATLKDARRKAHQHVKALEAEAKAAAKSWRYHGRRAVRAQRAAHMPEHVYERHEDHMEDAVGDAEDKAEDAAERLEEQLSHHYEKLEDELADASFDASGKALRQRAEKAQHRLQELARNLGAHAALKEALAKARFAAEEKSWKESHAPQLLDAAASGDHLRGLLIASVFTASFVAALAFVQRRRPVKVDAPPLLG